MKIAIVTNFTDSINYGAVLQAYALNHFLGAKKFDVVTLSYSASKGRKAIFKKFYMAIINSGNIFYPFNYLFSKWRMKSKLKLRIAIFNDFRKNKVRQSILYKGGNIYDSLNEYDIFICGSDQIWRPSIYTNKLNSIFWLAFVPDYKGKIAYAASIGVENFRNSSLEKEATGYLESFDFISVRENSANEYLSGLMPNKPITTVLDPVFLVEKEYWNSFERKYEIDGNDYLFAYFIEGCKQKYEETSIFAIENKLKVVTFPFMSDIGKACDIGYSDYNIIDASPENFVSLIKNAKYIFTDSYHVNVFSIIFHKEFYVYAIGEYSTRIKHLNKMFGLEKRMISLKNNSSPRNDEAKDWNGVDVVLEKLRNESIVFLMNAIDITSKKVKPR